MFTLIYVINFTPQSLQIQLRLRSIDIMKSYSISSDSSSDDEVLSEVKQKQSFSRDESKQQEDDNTYSSLCKQDWQQCEFCDEIFVNRYDLIRHNITHIIIPLIKQTPYQCQQCYHYYNTAEELSTHTSKHHRKQSRSNTQDKILQSIVQKEVFIRCENDLNDILSKNDMKVKNSLHNTEATESIERNNQADVELDIVKNEPFSPPNRNRSNTPSDDEKESIKHRLIFEDDIEDTLFKNLSTECHVNIETLCQQISLDFDDSLIVDDEGVDIDIKEEIHDLENETNNIESINNLGLNNLGNENGISNIVLSSIKNGISDIGLAINNFKSGLNASNGINHLQSAANNFTMDNINDNFNVSTVLPDSIKQSTELIKYSEAIHFDTLTVPDICVCEYCGEEFCNRFQLHQHEIKHIQMKKKQKILLCCLCDKYIAGNYRNLRQHKLNEHPEKADLNIQYTMHTCPKCHLKYYNYSKHMKNYHENFKCLNCKRFFDTLKQKNVHQCGKLILSFRKPHSDKQPTVLQLCDLCFSFMKIYMQNRHNYEEVGTKSELGVQQTCDKCNNKYFTVKLVSRRSIVKPLEMPKQKVKPLSNKERLIKIQNRLKMMKKINKC